MSPDYASLHPGYLFMNSTVGLVMPVSLVSGIKSLGILSRVNDAHCTLGAITDLGDAMRGIDRHEFRLG